MPSIFFALQPQQETQWCWAAMAVSIDQTLRNPKPSTATQCRLANTALIRMDCCSAPCPDACNQASSLGAALAALGWLRGAPTTGAIALEVVETRIGANQPVPVRIQGSLSRAFHIVAISGWDPTLGVLVQNPAHGGSATWVLFAEFPNQYPLYPGDWVNTYQVGK